MALRESITNAPTVAAGFISFAAVVVALAVALR